MSFARLKIIFYSFLVLYAVNIGRFFYWQVLHSSQLRQKSISQSYKIDKLPATKGKIYTQDGYPIVTNTEKYNLSIYKPDLDQDISLLNLFPQDTQQLINFLKNDDQKWISLARDFDNVDTKLVSIGGIIFQPISRRFYPEDSMLQPTLSGVERYYQKQLSGKDGFLWTPKDAIGNNRISQESWQIDPIDGLDIHLNINRSVQFIVEKNLEKGIGQYAADSGSVIVMDPPTGKIIAISSMVSSESATRRSDRNTPIADIFEPGSIFKPIVIAIALDSHSIDTRYTCQNCDRQKKIGDDTITNWDQQLHPNSSLRDIIKNSDNIGMSEVMERIGLEKFLKYYQLLQLDKRTGVDLPGEGKAPLKKYWSEIDLAAASFGQGIAMTQLQMLSIFNSIANGGELLRPKVAMNAIYDNKTAPIRVFSPEVIQSLKSILKYSTETGAVAKLIPKDIEACAKSGTAQVAIRGQYNNTNINASYIGFSPCNNPQVSIIVTLNNPKTSPWGSSTAAPIWFDIVDQISRLL